MNFFTVVTDIFKTWADESLVSLFDILSRHGLVLALIEWFVPFLHDFVHFFDVFLHLFDELINFSNNFHSLVDEWVDVITVPLKLSETWVKSIHHHLDAVSQKWLLNWEQGCQNVVEHVDSKLKVTSLSAVDVNFSIKGLGTVWNFDID